MKYIIADDEPLARARIIRLLEAWPHYECVAQLSSGSDISAAISSKQAKLLFLDINMPGLNGIEAAKLINQSHQDVKIVFITAFSDYALDAFNVFAAGFLVKPVSQDDLFSLLERLFKPSIQYQVGNQTRWINVEDILFAKAEDKVTQIYFADGEASIDLSLKKLNSLYSQHFVQIHRNALVKLSAIEQLVQNAAGATITLRGRSETLAVSRRSLSTLKSRL